MGYIALERFADLQDGKRIYNAGDEFPRKGLIVSEERLRELSEGRNKASRPLIKKVSTKEAEAPKSGESGARNAKVDKGAKNPPARTAKRKANGK